MTSPSWEHDLIVPDRIERADDGELTRLLTEVYVHGGFTNADVAVSAFAATTVRARGQLFWAKGSTGELLGLVVLVPPTSPARRLASNDEAELHLLAVDPRMRRKGLGSALIETLVETARQRGYRQLVLWTQPTMHSAHRLYSKAGFLASPKEDFERGGRQFQVFRLALEIDEQTAT